jgi:hypothetical protein
LIEEKGILGGDGELNPSVSAVSSMDLFGVVFRSGALRCAVASPPRLFGLLFGAEGFEKFIASLTRPAT